LFWDLATFVVHLDEAPPPIYLLAPSLNKVWTSLGVRKVNVFGEWINDKRLWTGQRVSS
jgi:hypothetical protein